MKRALNVTAFLAMGILMATSYAAGQSQPPQAPQVPATILGGQVSMDVIGRDNVSSSKFDEYRVVPEGVSLPNLNFFRSGSTFDVNFVASSVAQDDQRYTGWAKVSGVGVSFDYNQIPHNMGNNGLVIFNETSPGIWSMSQTLRRSIHDSVDATPTAGRTYAFYQNLLAPTAASANPLDFASLRQRGHVAVDLGQRLPFGLEAIYLREVKTGSRGASGGDILGAVTSTFDVPEPLNEVVQDFGLRASHTVKTVSFYGSINRNVYDNRAETLVVPNPFQAADEVYTGAVGSTPALGGPASVRMINPPDNEATTGRAGFQLKLKRQTRLSGDFSLASWTQNAAFYPYTINSAILTGTGQPADQVSSLQQQSLNGKINTTMFNVSFSSRPIRGLGVRARFRSYDLSNETTRFVITGDTSGSPDRSWSATTATPDAPFGHATANAYDTTTNRFDTSVSYDIKGVTLEGVFRYSDLSRTFREATSGSDVGGGFSALFNVNDWVGVRGTWDRTDRSAEGETIFGFQSDEAERELTRAGLDIELSPLAGLGVTFSYRRNDAQFPNRPDRIAVSGGAPVAGAQPIPDTPSGLLSASYDSFTTEVSYAMARADLIAYYTYDKNETINQWSTTSGVALNNLLNYEGTDQTDTFGASAVVRIVPDKWTFSLLVSDQRVDGLADITAREAGGFYTPGRTTVVAPGTGGAQDITDWDDTRLTTALAQLDYGLTRNWVIGAGYVYEKYTFGDAYTSGTALLPQSVLMFMKPDEGGYSMNIGFAKLSYRF